MRTASLWHGRGGMESLSPPPRSESSRHPVRHAGCSCGRYEHVVQGRAIEYCRQNSAPNYGATCIMIAVANGRHAK